MHSENGVIVLFWNEFLSHSWRIWCLSTRPQTTGAQWSLFSLKPQTFGFGQIIWKDKFLGYLRPIYQHQFWYCKPCWWFLLINHYFKKKLNLFIQIPKMYLGFEFELSRKELGIYPSCVRIPCTYLIAEK